MKFLFTFIILFLSISLGAQISTDALKQHLFYSALKFKVAGVYDEASNVYNHYLKLDNNSAAAFFELSQIACAKNDIPNALLYAQQALSVDTTSNIDLKKYCADLYFNNSEYKKAYDLFKEICSVEKDNLLSLIKLARLSAVVVSVEESVRLLDSVKLSHNINDDFFFDEYLTVLSLSENQKFALKIFKRLLKEYPDNSFLYYIISKYHYSLNNLPEAKAFLRKAHSLDSIRFSFDIAKAYLTDEDYDAFFHAAHVGLVSNISSELKYEFLVYCLSADKKLLEQPYFDQLYFEANQVFNLHPDEEPIVRLFAIISDYKQSNSFLDISASYLSNYLGSEDYYIVYFQSVIKELTGSENDSITLEKYISPNLPKALSFYPENPLINYYASLFSLSNSDTVSSINYGEKAVSLLQNVYKNNKYFLSSYIHILDVLATLHFYSGNKSQSFSYLEQIISIVPDYSSALNNYAYYLALSNEGLDKAEAMSKKSLDLSPSNPTYLDTYAWVLYMQKRYSEALFVMNFCIDLSGDDASFEMYDHYGDILLKLDRKQEAIEYWSKALKLSPSNQQIINKLKNAH